MSLPSSSRSNPPNLPAAPVVSARASGPPLLPARRRKKRFIAVLGAAGAVSISLAALLVWDASRSGPVWYGVKKLAGLVESPHDLGRWYAFGHRHGERQAAASRALGLPVVAQAADLAYTLKTLGVENPPREAYDLCLRGFLDGVAGRPLRYVPQVNAAGDDAFPEPLEGL